MNAFNMHVHRSLLQSRNNPPTRNEITALPLSVPLYDPVSKCSTESTSPEK